MFHDLHNAFQKVPDPRRPQGRRHPLPALLIAYTAALLCNCIHTAAIVEWLKHHEDNIHLFGLDHGSPSESTYSRIFKRITPKRFARIIGKAAKTWLSMGAQLAIDGKTSRAAHVGEDGKPVHILAFVATGAFECVHAAIVDKKRNEASVAKKLLPSVLKGMPGLSVISGDAMFLQKTICQAIRKAKMKYLIKLKANQKTQYNEAKRLLSRKRKAHFTMTRKNHGRIETYKVFVTDEIEGWFDWPDLQSALRVEKTTKYVRWGKVEKETVTNHYALSSLPANAQSLFSIYLEHWSIETSFAIKDVAFQEDRHAVQSDQTALITAMLRAQALSLLQRIRGEQGFAKTLRVLALDPKPIWNAIKNIQN
jgi:predicted transposase YbfD/YdcC